MIRVSFMGNRALSGAIAFHCRLVRVTGFSRLHAGRVLNVSDSERAAEKELKQRFAPSCEDHSHDHVHLRQSETEENDSMILGSMRHRKAQQAQLQQQQQPEKHSSSHSHSHSHSQSHSHSHSHMAINPMLVMSKEQVKRNPGVRITWIGLAINVGLALGKFAGGFIFHSQALMADAVHAVSDMVSDFLTLFSVGLASNKPTSDYPFGYGKIETVGSLAVSTILATAGLSIGWTSLCAIVGPIVPHTVIETLATYIGESHSHSHSITKEVTNVNAAWIAGASIVVKEWIFQATKKIAVQTNSNVLMANAWHHRIDSLTSLVALVTITSGYFFNIQSLDAFGGLIVSGLVIKAGGEGMLSALRELADQSLPRDDDRYLEVESAINDALGKLVSNNNAGRPYAIKDLTVLPSGPNLRANVVLETPLQRWDNVLDIKEFEIVSDHLRTILYRDIPALRRLHIEFVEEATEEDDSPEDQQAPSGHHHSHSTSSETHKH
ncbi:hypothetical protein HG536_0D04000 [Torulaspora globosa]|uniref:Cation efflux protein transmembrane domain-containing protein n=1 Tax=Torulaspora globosa TaxID=48254 RepID=A0A7G3ZH92_9SACH|nr:uncharacterized protein HG536_0D04000 [Torulaspora globosa]QLL32878.1 hypothetical protein HG536_0D04000 [Torulaspora globosa]